MQPQDAQIQAIAQALAGGAGAGVPTGSHATFIMPHGIPNMNNNKLAWREYSASLPGAMKVQNPNTIGGGSGTGPGPSPGGGGGWPVDPTNPANPANPNPTVTNPVVTNPQLPVGSMPGNNGASLVAPNMNNYAAKLIAQQGAPKTQEAQNNLGSELANQMMAVGRPPAGGYPASANTVSSGNILAAVRLAQQAGTFNGNPLDAYAQYKDQLNLPTSPVPWDPTAGGGG
jgi:hypothetical protein